MTGLEGKQIKTWFVCLFAFKSTERGPGGAACMNGGHGGGMDSLSCYLNAPTPSIGSTVHPFCMNSALTSRISPPSSRRCSSSMCRGPDSPQLPSDHFELGYADNRLHHVPANGSHHSWSAGQLVLASLVPFGVDFYFLPFPRRLTSCRGLYCFLLSVLLWSSPFFSSLLSGKFRIF